MIRFLLERKGATAVETAMLMLPFFVLITVLVEVLLLIYSTVALDYINSQAGEYASSLSYKDGYSTRYREMIDKQRERIGFFLSDGSYDYDISYCKNLEELKENKCEASNQDAMINVYELTYRVRTIFLYNWIDPNKTIKSRLAYYNERNGTQDPDR